MKIYQAILFLLLMTHFFRGYSGESMYTHRVSDGGTMTYSRSDLLVSSEKDTAIASVVSDGILYKDGDTIARCTFKGGSNDNGCLHIIFSCGDFGLAETKLATEAETLWNALVIEGSAGEEGNVVYIGKVFEITYQKTSVTPCNGPEDPTQVDAPRVINFKQVKVL